MAKKAFEPKAGCGTSALNRWRGNRPIIEATEPLFLKPTKTDYKRAKRGDPARCVFALAAKRQWHAVDAFFWRTVAYIGMKDENGREVVYRYQLDKYAKQAIIDFDSGRKLADFIGVVLKPPDKNRTMEGQRHNQRVMAKRRKENGDEYRSHRTRGNRTEKRALEMQLVRCGTGFRMAHHNGGFVIARER